MAKNAEAVRLGKLRWAGTTEADRSAAGTALAKLAAKSMTAAERSARASKAAKAKHRKYLENKALKKIP